MVAKTDTDEAFTPEQEERLGEIIANALKGDPPKPKEDRDPPKAPPTDDEWTRMGPAQREGYVKTLVHDVLGQISNDDKTAALAAEVERLKAKEGEKPPDLFSKMREWLWGKEPVDQ